MNIINKIKDNIFVLFQNKIFRILLTILFLVFIIKNYTSVFENIDNFKKENNLNSLSVAEIKNSIDTKIVKNKREEEKEREKEQIIREKQTEIMKNVKIPEITKDSRIFIVDFILFNKNEKNILTKMEDMQILVTDNNSNPFAKYLKGKKVGEIVIIPISEIADQKLPKTDIFYKMTIKNIKKLTE